MSINIDAAGEWADETARRWITTNPMKRLDAGSEPGKIRTAVIDTIEQVSHAMAEKTRAAGCYADGTPSACKTWLETCCNQLAEPDEATKPNRTTRRIGDADATAAETAPLLRWAGASRVEAQKAGLRWTRGRDRGPLEFDVMVVGGVQTIVEHGWPTDANQLVARMAAAIATATRRTAEAQGTPSASIAKLTQTLIGDARQRAAATSAQRPAWVDQPRS